MNTAAERLAAKVNAVNKANAYAKQLLPKLQDTFRPFLGQQIDKKTGGMMAKVKAAVDALDLPNTPNLSVFRHHNSYSLCFIVKVCVVTNGIGTYHETMVQVAEMNGDFLKDTFYPPEWNVFKDDHTPERVEQLRDTYRKAKRKADDARNALDPFGEWDN